jgi:hypothetical protein
MMNERELYDEIFRRDEIIGSYKSLVDRHDVVRADFKVEILRLKAEITRLKADAKTTRNAAWEAGRDAAVELMMNWDDKEPIANAIRNLKRPKEKT